MCCVKHILTKCPNLIFTSSWLSPCRHKPPHLSLQGVNVLMSWRYGPGFLALFVATALKLVHIALHVAVRSP